MASTAHLFSMGFSVRIMGMFLISLISLCSSNQAQALDINGGASLVNNPSVQLSLNLPEYCYEIQIRNEEGVASPSAPSSTLSWTLSPGDGQKTVTVTYLFYYYYTYQCGTYCCGYDWLGRCTTYCPKYCQGQGSSSSSESQQVILDQTPPVLTLSISAGGSYTNNGTLGVNGTCLDLNGIQDLNVAGMHLAIGLWDIYSTTIQLNPGNNVINATAIDNAGNLSTASRSIFYDNQDPILSVDYPAQPMSTNKSSIILKGSVTDWTEATVEIKMGDYTYNPPVVDGKYEQGLSFSEERGYDITVSATDMASNKTLIERQIIYDDTPPILEIDAVSSPTPRKIQIIHGTMEKGCIVSAECATASIGPISYPNDNTWSGLVSNLAIGTNTVIVTANDAAENKTTVNATIEVFEPLLGDFNVDQVVDLTDAILGMQIILGTVPEQDVFWEADVNSDNQIGLPDVIYILQFLANER